ncbi:M64 family metallopeptidase [Williamwhitmania taraxaci]|uniref:Peptidase M64 N-terminus n=1 Tax=Williamwhitmania taraxaci TaxID=1640674 RepID=A0A1G6GG45_9BACT|nr:M64 family metallopeptidase [Williamwhitmania taraxaci]SDB80978.1 Peptidase M64 N-terminus [Williamwhitmania taraxaci]
MRWIILSFAALCSGACYGQSVSFADYFETTTALRIDFSLAGNAQTQTAYFDAAYSEVVWGGNPSNTVESYSYGEYSFKVFDKETNTLIFSKGFSSLFQEWRTTEEAKLVARAFTQSVRIPRPIKPFKIEISERRKVDGLFYAMFSMDLDPKSIFINGEKRQKYPVAELQKMGDPDKKVDLVIIAEGYQSGEMDTFVADANRLIDYMFQYEPYKTNRGNFNIWLVKSNSQDSGPDNPGKNQWKSTVAGSTFYTFNEERYLTTFDYKSIADLITGVPCDAVYVLVNSEKYGGGGIFGYYALSSSRHASSPQVFIHEFGHSFAGLGDEYFDSSTPYGDFYNLKVEPWEPNITTMVNFASKWKDMVAVTTPIPTPAMDANADIIGLFEGGGYMTKGIFRPMQKCRMRTNVAKGFCPVCQKSIEKVIQFYCK